MTSSITIPESMTSIGERTFYGCSALTSITIPNSVTSIGGSAFEGCSGLTSITIPNSVTSIGEYAFYGSGLTSVTIPNSVTAIGFGAFESCNGLRSVTINCDVVSGWFGWENYSIDEIILGEGVTSIGNSAFWQCYSLTSVTIGNSVTSIGNGAFSDCIMLSSVTIGNSVTSIGNSAFYGCRLNSITIPDNVTSIGSSAFEDCYYLTSVTIGNNVTSIGNGAFYNCGSIAIVNVKRNNYSDFIANNIWVQYLPTAATATWNYYINDNLVTNLNIPSSVTSIGDYAFYNAKGITSLTLPSSLTSIGSSAFSGCTGITSLTLPSSLTSIGNSAFQNCNGLASVNIPESVTSIGNNAFQNCSGLTSITIGNGVTSIGDGALSGCSSLSSVNVYCPSTCFGTGVFDGCNSIKEVMFDCETVTPLFRGKSSLEKITLKENVTNIEARAFADIDNLTDVICYAKDVPNTNRTSFENSYINYVTLHVPVESVNKYEETAPWSGFKQIIPIGGNVFNLTYIVDGEVYKSYEVEYGALITPEPAPTKEGYTFSGWSEIPETMPAEDVVVTGSFIINCEEVAVNIGSSGYATFCSPYALDFSGVTELKAYIASGFSPSTGKLVLTRVDEVPAGEGLYLVGEGGTYSVPVTETDMLYANFLKGVTTATTISPTEGSYTNFILANGSHGIGFYTISSAGQVAAGKAYLQLPTSSVSHIKAISVIFEDDDATAIQNTEGYIKAEGIYNLQGQKVSTPRNGLYIINGKKVLIK